MTDAMTPDIAELIAAAREAMRHAHAPYSKFAVGAALRMADKSIITGANFENASYGLSLCAETVAIATASGQGKLADITSIAVVGGPIGGVGDAIVTPCGRCRQIITEAAQMGDRDIIVHCAGATGDAWVSHSIADLLPHAFGPANLGISPRPKD